MADTPVLVIEDHTDAREMLVEWLEALGYQTASASNGADAIEQLRKGLRPSLVLLDMMMPVMDGWTFMKEALRLQLLDGCEVWVVSAVHAMKTPEGVKGVVAKPVDLTLLRSVLERSGKKLPKS